MIHTITIITCTTNCMLSIFCSTICSSSGILIVNNGGNVLLIEFALAEGMPELLMFVVEKILYTRIHKFLDKNNILYESQFGF